MNAVENFIRAITPLALLGFILTSISNAVAGPVSAGMITSPQVYSAMIFVTCFLLVLALFFVIDSVSLAKTFVDNSSRHLDIVALWKSLPIMPAMLTGSAVITLIVLSLDGNASLVEIYRTHTLVWYDRILWNIEAPLFRAVAASEVLPLKYWEGIYHMMWIYVLLVMAALIKNGRTESYMTLAIAIVLAFYCTTCIALLFPVAGPQYYRPELFGYLGSSPSKLLQDILGNYQAGKIPQNGLYYGTMAMPSLHVALTAMATWFIARHWPSLIWPALAWAALVWMSTVVLAWHYALDGVAAIGVSSICILCARTIVRLSQKRAKTG
jgi:hypothetical protein